MENITMKLAEFVSSLEYDHISDKAIQNIKNCFLDSLGCAIYGSTTQWGGIVNDFVISQQGVQEASLWTTEFCGPAANVVLGNGTMVHSYDYDDYHNTKIHPGAPVIPAALAIGEKENINGKELITAVVAGYETMIHINRGLNPSASRLKGWHLTGTCGTFAAAAAVGRIWQFDAEKMANALGMAGTQSAGLWAFTADGSFSKRFHPGRSAQSGIIAASLVRRGYRGPIKILEAEDGGFFRATSDDFDYSKVTEGLGIKFDTEDVAIKPYPACASVHSSVDAALIIKKEHDIDIGKIKEINVYNSELVNLQCGFEYKPMGVLQAQMSLKYCVARAVIDNLLSMPQFTEESFSDPIAVDLAGRVNFVLDDEINAIYPREFPSIVEIVMKSGERHKARVEAPSGSIKKQLSWQAVQEKFLSLAVPLISKEKAETIIESIEKLENITDISTIPKLLTK